MQLRVHCFPISDFIRSVPLPLQLLSEKEIRVTLKVTLIRQITVGHILVFEKESTYMVNSLTTCS